MLQIILMFLIVGFFAKLSQKQGIPIWLVYVFKSITLLLLLYVIFIVSTSFFGPQIAAVVTSIIGGVLIAIMIFNYKKNVQKRAEAQKEIDDIGKQA